MIFPKIYILFLTDLADLFIVKKAARTIQSIAFPDGGSRCQNNMLGRRLSVLFFS